jgi:RNA-directed DNA polymerase
MSISKSDPFHLLCSRFKSGLHRLTGRSWGVSMEYRYWKIRTYLRGWMNYFGIAMKYNNAVEKDHWLRRRIRMPGGVGRNG